jgi:hypothetical protein
MSDPTGSGRATRFSLGIAFRGGTYAPVDIARPIILDPRTAHSHCPRQPLLSRVAGAARESKAVRGDGHPRADAGRSRNRLSAPRASPSARARPARLSQPAQMRPPRQFQPAMGTGRSWPGGGAVGGAETAGLHQDRTTTVTDTGHRRNGATPCTSDPVGCLKAASRDRCDGCHRPSDGSTAPCRRWSRSELRRSP